MASVNFNMRLDEDLRNRAFPVIESFGLSPAQAFKLFLTQVAATNSLPLSFDYKEKSDAGRTVAFAGIRPPDGMRRICHV